MSNTEDAALQKRAQTTEKVKASEAVERVRAVLEARRKSYWKENPLVVGGSPVDEEEHNGIAGGDAGEAGSGPVGDQCGRDRGRRQDSS